MREEVIQHARECLGVRFQHQGKTKRGMDCRGLLIYAFNLAGLQVHDVSGYGREPDPEMMNKALLEVCYKVPFDHILPADIIYFRFNERPTHLALYTGNNRIIHSYLQTRKVVEHEIDRSWWLSVAAVYRHMEFAE